MKLRADGRNCAAGSTALKTNKTQPHKHRKIRCMDVTRQLQEILAQINNDLAPQDRVCEHEIAHVGGELNQMLNTAVQQASGNLPPPAAPRSLKQKLAALWSAIKDKLAAWLSPAMPRWVRFVNALRRKLEGWEGAGGVLAIALVAIAVALVAALVKSMSLLIALLAIIGFARLLKEILPVRFSV